MKSNRGLHSIAFILVAIGAINWGLIGFFGYNLVGAILGYSILANIVYDLVGLSGVFLIWTHKDTCKMCGSGIMNNVKNMNMNNSGMNHDQK